MFARSTHSGNAKASTSGTSSSMVLTHSFFISISYKDAKRACSTARIMKHNKLLLRNLSRRLILFGMMTLISLNLFASDFTFEGVNYTIISEKEKTCKTVGSNVKGDLILPPHPNGYTLVRLGNDSFRDNDELISVVIPETVITIGQNCFQDCTSLSSIVVPASVTSIERYAFSGCTLRPLKIEGDPGADSYILNGVVQYSGYKGLKKGSFIVCLPENVNKTKELCEVMVYPDNLPYFPVVTKYVKGFGIQLYKSESYDKEIDDFSISVTRSSNKSETETISDIMDEYLFKNLLAQSTYTICMKWKDSESGEEKSYSLVENTLNAEFKWRSSMTQTSIKIESLSAVEDITFEPTEYEVVLDGKKYNASSLPIIISDLYPETEYDVTFNATNGTEVLASRVTYMSTHSWGCKVQAIGKSSTTASATAAFTEEDAKPDKVWWACGETELAGTAATFVSLTPNENQSLAFYIKYKDRPYLYPLDVKTDELELTTLKPKCVSETCAIVAAQTNISDVEPSVGFEWKKYDAPASLPASEGYGVVCEGMLEGYIKNLQPTSFYNVRPFYKSGEGKYYYGDWITFDPSDFSYFEPTIRTYPVQDITEKSATVKGYVLQGTDDIKSQGFQYWKTGRKKTKGNAPSDSDITTVVATGQVMTVTLDDLEAATDYTFRVFVETKAGFTYGDEQQFTTEGVSSVVEIDEEVSSPKVVCYYDMMGVRSDKPHKGLNIVVYSDGTSKKVMK